MGRHARREYLARMRERYERADKAARSRLLDGVCEVTGYHRKGVIRRLQRPAVRRVRRRGRPVRYGPTVVGPLRRIWEAAGYPWSLRLRALLPAWLPWATRRWKIPADVAKRLRTMSPRQMDRVLRPFKQELRKRQYGRTKPGTLLKHQIPLKTDRCDVQVAGFTEIDLVAHSGDRADGEFVHSLNLTDIHTTWVDTRAVMGKSQHDVQEALEHMRQQLPFRLQGIDSDNGSEFINHHLHRYCGAQGIADLRLLQNLFLPSVKLIEKTRIGARIRRRYDAPRTAARARGGVPRHRSRAGARSAAGPRAAGTDRVRRADRRAADRRVPPGESAGQSRGADKHAARGRSGPVDAQTASRRSLETTERFPQRPHASAASKTAVTRLMARRCAAWEPLLMA